MILALPTEILMKILASCDVGNITLVCRSLATIAYSIPSLWSTICLRSHQFVPEGLLFLRVRLERSRNHPLEVSVQAADSNKKTIISDMCSILAAYATCIHRLEISADTSQSAGTILHNVLLNSITVSPALHSLAIRVHSDFYWEVRHTPMRLDKLLDDAAEVFSSLQSLTLPVHDDCIPFPATSASFSHLHTLILDGSLEEEPPIMASISAFLHHTPNLETLWLKTQDQATWEHVIGRSTLSLSHKTPHPISIPVTLPRLTRLAITVPGAGLDILHCIETPALRDLHLDGSRGLEFIDTWDHYHVNEVLTALKKLASHAPDLRRLALTEVYLSQPVWKWLLLGEEQVVPFPLLGSIAIHRVDLTSSYVLNGLDDAVLSQFSRGPRIPLRRLALLQCKETLDGSVLVEVFESLIREAPDEIFTVEIDTCCHGVTEQHIEALISRGIKAVYHREPRRAQTMDWWAEGRAQPSDSCVY